MMPPFHIGVGSNIDAGRNIAKGLSLLRRKTRMIAISPFYWSEAIGKDGLASGRPPFLNGVFVCSFGADAATLKENVLMDVERELGRVRAKDKFADRPLDLDILLWGAHRSESPQIPDPDIFKRAFVALPLYEVAGNIPLPGDDRCLGDVVKEMDTSDLRRDDLITQTLQTQLQGKEII